MKRQRGRSRRNNNHNNSNRSMESSGPDVKVRGTAKQIFDKYETLARDAASSGSRVKAENYRQHAEHYLRIVNAIEAAKQAAQAAKEGADAARNENQAGSDNAGNEDGSSGKDRSKRRYPPKVNQSKQDDKENSEVSGLEVVETNGSESDSGLKSGSEKEGKPATKSTRRRKALSRETSEDETATEAAE